MENVFACYRNIEGKWVIDGDRGRDTYPGNWLREMVVKAYQDHPDGYLPPSIGKYEVSVYSHDVKYEGGYAALVTINKFDEKDTPLGQKSFYLQNGKKWNPRITEEEVDEIFNRKEGAWI